MLVIDDEAPVRRLLSKVFVREGYEVLTAASGEEAIGIVRDRAIDLALVDLKMPGIDGIETIRQIKKINMGVSFIVITAFGEMSSVKEATTLGVYDYITKPFDLEYVKHLVSHIIEGIRPRILPYAEDMKQILTGELTSEEVKKRKLDSFKADIDERRELLKDMHKYIDREVSTYYTSLPFLEASLHRLKKLATNFYFIIIVLSIIIGISFSYIYGMFSSKRLYRAPSGRERVSLYDFYKALNEIRYWMQKHTEQGVRMEEESERVR